MSKVGVARGAAALGATRIATNLANLGALVVLARLLTPQDFGLVAICTTVLGVLVALTELSVGSALIQRDEVTPAHIDSAWTMSLLRAALIAGGFALASEPLARLYGDDRLAPLFVLSGITGALAGLTNPLVSLRMRAMNFRPMIMLQIVQKLSALAISVGLALWLRNYWAIVVGSAIGGALGTVLSYLVVPYRPRFTLSRSRDLLGFSSWLFLGQVMNVVNWRFDQLVIGLFLPTAQLGAYSMADNVSAIPSREATTPLVQTLFPSFARMQGDRARLRSAYQTAQGAIGIVALPIAVGFMLLADPMVRVALGQKWLITVPLIQVIGFSYALQTLVTGSRPLAMAEGATRTLFVRDVWGLALRVPCVTVGLMGWGLMGLVWGRLLSSVLGLFITSALVTKLTGLSVLDQMKAHRRTVAAVGVMAAAVLAADHELLQVGAVPIARIAVLAPLGALTYLGTLHLLWIGSGRSAGAEAELLGLARTAFARFRKGRTAPAITGA
ncbi:MULTISPECIES: lipopolysaccharide biosynthesis protein [Novosphingobium]|jgi:O-antigen/teichoic acid export membrane protein|uniref:lipopolysaccharide biosynthesis protein n=1 Tax=Novosphingobium TaxID=165696 RepID=UPI0022F29138|nr:lipopolysaccharide biosynthesis protein [Novosphingobium resinovorum]GLK45855.1 lipopolysaccharide biosynthesis protein [Novosphingobium resinovorum]